MKSRNTLTCALAVLAMSTLSACNSSEPLAVSKTDVPATQNGQTTPGAQTAPGAATTTTPATTATQSVPTPGTATQSGTAPVPAPTPGAQANVSPVPGNAQTAKLRFAPIVGAPIAAATPLSQRLSAIAKQKGITLGTAADTNNTHVMKGYFSALPDGNQTTIIYVWDVLDPAGTRLHRIQGQEKVPGGGADPWATVPAKTMEDIADKAMQGYLTWVSSAKT
jgi:hypothetical protein